MRCIAHQKKIRPTKLPALQLSIGVVHRQIGADEKIAGLKNRENLQVADLKKRLEEDLPVELVGKLDVVVLDLARL